MDLFDAIKGCRSVREYKELAVDEKTIRDLIEAALPSRRAISPRREAKRRSGSPPAARR